MSNADDVWLIRTLDGVETNVSGAVLVDTDGGVVEFRDKSGNLSAFFNLGAVSSGERIDDEEDE